MLRELHIENIAVIEKADIEFNAGLNILTGETGAGKSIIIDSIGAVLGSRIGKEAVRNGAEKGSVHAVFDSEPAKPWLEENEIDCDDDDLIIQRQILSDGKTKCRVNGSPVTVAQLKSLGTMLVDVHGQNDGRLLLDEKNHLEYLDRFVQPQEEINAFSSAYKEYKKLLSEKESLSYDEIEKERLSDSLTYQIEELEKAALKEGEYDKLCARRDLLRNSEKLTEALDEALAALNGGEENAMSFISNASYYANRAANYTKDLEEAAASLDDVSFSIQNAYETLKDYRESLDFSPQEYDRLESRISQLNRLERKYSRTIEELIPYLDECRTKLDRITYADERLAKLDKLLKAQKEVCLKAADLLTQKRQEGAAQLQKRIEAELKSLSMPSVRFCVDRQPVREEPGFNSHGADEIVFLMAANAGMEPGKINKIASGGELSRIMLAMKNVFSEHDPVPTMVFDEIDTGISGVAAQRVAEKLFSVSQGKQVMCVTHLPQIAAMADSHYIIRKSERNGKTFTEVHEMDLEGRKMELARLYGGDHVTETTLAGAAEQINGAGQFKADFHNLMPISNG